MLPLLPAIDDYAYDALAFRPLPDAISMRFFSIIATIDDFRADRPPFSPLIVAGCRRLMTFSAAGCRNIFDWGHAAPCFLRCRYWMLIFDYCFQSPPADLAGCFLRMLSADAGASQLRIYFFDDFVYLLMLMGLLLRLIFDAGVISSLAS